MGLQREDWGCGMEQLMEYTLARGNTPVRGSGVRAVDGEEQACEEGEKVGA